MGITIFQIFIWGGISLYSQNKISNHLSDDMPPQIKISDTGIH